MVLCAALALMFQAEPVLTYQTPAQSIEQVLLALSKQAGAPLQASTDLRDEPLVVRFGAVPLSEAKARIAKVTSAEWEQLPQGGSRLTRSDALARKLEGEALQKRVKLLQPHLDKIRQELEKEPPLNAERAKMLAAKMAGSWETAQRDHQNYAAQMEAQGFGPWSPQARALKQILLGVDPARLATIERGRSRVFSNVPTDFQEELPQELCTNVLSEFGEARDLLKDELSKGLEADRQDRNPYGYVLAINHMEAAIPTRLVLIIDCDELGTLTASLLGRNDDGVDVLTERRRLVDNTPVYNDSPQFKSRLTELQNHPGLEPGDFLTDLSEFLRSFTSNPDGARLSQRSLDRVLSPETYDPLAPIGELLITWAEIEGKNLVAYPPDFLVGTSFALSQGQKVKVPFLVDLMRSYGAETEIDEAWIESAPTFPLEANAERTPREALGIFLRRTAEESFLSIDNQVEFANACGPRQSLMRPLVFFCVGQHQLNLADWDVLRLAASLQEADLQLMKVGAELSSLPTEVQENYLRVLLHSEGWERPLDVNEFLDTPTEFLSDSYADHRAYVREHVEPKFWLKYEGDSKLEHQRMIDLRGLASMMYWEERQPGEYKCLAVAEMGVHELVFEVQASGRVKRFKLQEFRTPTELHPMDSLPPDLKARLTAEMAVVAREHEKQMQGSPQ